MEVKKDIKQMTSEDKKQLIKEVKEGKKKHKQTEVMLDNIKGHNLRDLDKTDPQRAKEIRRKGWEAMTKIKGERKSAKESLEQFLPLFALDATTDENIPEDIRKILKQNKNVKVTQYDLIMLAMINQARQGNVKAAEYIANHYGDVVVKESHNVSEVISASDKALIDKISERLNIIDVDIK